MNSTPRCQCFAGYAIETCFTEVWTAVRSSMTHSALCCSKLETQGRKSKAVRQEKCVVRVSVYNIYMYITYTIFFFKLKKKCLCVCVGGEQTGPFSCCFSIGYSWPHPVPHRFKTKQRLTSLSLSHSLSLSQDKAGTPLPSYSFSPILFLKRGEAEAGPSSTFCLLSTK